MTIYTSYYRGQIQGEAVSISLYPPPNWKGKHLLLFAPTPELLKWWKSLAQDEAAQQEYKRHFHEILQSRQQLIELWVNKQKQNPVDMTLCCFEKSGDFCHRHQVGEEVVQTYIPELWGGEVNNSQLAVRNSQLFLTANCQYPHQVLSLIEKCHDSGYLVKCLRLRCGYYRVSLGDEDLGDWSELGLLGVLSGLCSDFYRARWFLRS